jgi:phosphatidylserine/phosphatidylglycerophosphate/cardiolipin synthase-like enzyme
MSQRTGQPVLDGLLELVRDLPAGALERLVDALDRLPDDPTASELNHRVAQIEPAALRRQVIDWLMAWKAGGAAPPGAALALALRSAAAMHQWHRDRQVLDLVWTGPVPEGSHFRRTDQALLQLIDAAQSELLIVSFVAYKVPLVKEALARAAQRGVTIKLVLESSEESEGRATFSALLALGDEVARRSEVYYWPRERRGGVPGRRLPALHAKCAVADSRLLLLSSANLTEYALDKNMELGVLVSGGELPRMVWSHFVALAQQGHLESPRPPGSASH